jgi:arginyl-tRNA synthetase
MRQHVVDIVRAALARGASAGRWPALESAFTVEPPRDPRHGDFAVNAAMVLAKPAGRPPRELAQGIVEEIRAVDGGRSIEAIDIAGPGFVNLRLRPEVWLAGLSEVDRQGDRFGRTEVGKGKRVNVEFVSANPTGPMHVGHGRNAVTGDAVASLLDWSGHAVTREYYVNDFGAQVQTLARSVHLRYQELLGRTVVMPPSSYPGAYVVDIARSLQEEFGPRFLDAPETEWLDLFRDRAVAHVLGMIRSDLGAVDITFDVWSSEKKLYDSGTVQRFLQELEAKDLVYWGKLPPPKSRKGQAQPVAGAENEEGLTESEDLLLFRSSRHGDEVDRPVKKADGTPTYFCADIAYHWDKLQRADQLVDVLGADHGGYVPRLHAALEALGGSRDDLHVVLIQMVNLTRGGEAVKMSKRAGTVVSLQEVVDEVGRDATRFIFLTRRADAQLDFDLELAKRQTLDNPVFYVQYGHARLARILEKAAEAGAAARFDLATLSVLTAPEEMDLVKRILSFPDLVAGAALAWEPHRVAYWLQETIGAFHSYYTQGKKSGERFIGSDPVKTAARLAMARALKQALANGLAVLGVSAPERMESREIAEDV